MGLMEQTVIKAKEVIDIAGKKTGELIELQKLRVSAASIQAQLSKEYEALGRLAYDLGKQGVAANEAFETLVQGIDEKKEELQVLEGKIATAKGDRICPACSTVNGMEAVFCNKCGQRVTFDSATAEESDEGGES